MAPRMAGFHPALQEIGAGNPLVPGTLLRYFILEAFLLILYYGFSYAF
jgi:hypothetical protein